MEVIVEKTHKTEVHETSNQVLLTTDLNMDKMEDADFQSNLNDKEITDRTKITQIITTEKQTIRSNSTREAQVNKKDRPTVDIPKSRRKFSTGDHVQSSPSQIEESKNESGEEENAVGIDIKQKCTKIFFNYAKYSLDLKEFFISHYTIINLLKTCNVFSLSSLHKSGIDVILRKACCKGTKLNLKEFMNFIILLTKKMYPDNYCNDQVETIVYVIKNYFEPLSNFIDNKTFNPEKTEKVATYNNVFHQKIIESMIKFMDNGVILMIRDSYLGIKAVYKSYFFYELNKFSNKDKLFFGSLSNMIEFFKDFEIMPALCGINQLVIYWNFITGINITDITNNPDYKLIIEEKLDMGNLMTLSRFCALLIYLGIMFYNNNKPNLGTESIQLKDSGKNSYNIY